MNNKKLGITIAAVVLIGLVVFQISKKNSDENTVEDSAVTPGTISRPNLEVKSKIVNKPGADGKSADVLSYRAADGNIQEQILTESEKSLVAMAQTLVTFASKGKTQQDFIAHLQSLGLRPVVARDEKEEIEDLTIIRTQNSLPGLRYIHAQYDGDGVQELQHLSFEIGKGEGALQRAVELVEKVAQIGTKVPSAPDMVVYKSNGYVFWFKQLHMEDLIGHPFNAYERGDEGNIRIAVERDIHPDEGMDGGHHEDDGHNHGGQNDSTGEGHPDDEGLQD